MTAFERIMATADEETLALVRRNWQGKYRAHSPQRRLRIQTGCKLNVDAVADIFFIASESAYHKTSRTETLK